ncbi:MAG: hypothetical protein AB7P35_17765 [Hyphomonadaceae bacterium]
MSGEAIAWAVAGFAGVLLVNMLVWIAVHFLGRQRTGESTQGNQAVDIGKLETRVTALERQSEEHADGRVLVAELRTEVRQLRNELRDMGLTMREFLMARALEGVHADHRTAHRPAR